MADLAGVNGQRKDFRVVGKPNLPGVLSWAQATGVAKFGVDYVIPSNDDAIRAIKLLVGKVAEAVLEGRAYRKEEETMDEAAAAMTPSTTRLGMEDDELDDKDLLGESTLAKMAGQTDEA